MACETDGHDAHGLDGRKEQQKSKEANNRCERENTARNEEKETPAMHAYNSRNNDGNPPRPPGCLTTDIPPRLEYGDALLSSRLRRSVERRRASSSDSATAHRPRSNEPNREECRLRGESNDTPMPKESRAWETPEALSISLVKLPLLDS